MRVAIVLNTSWNLYNFRRGLIDALRQEGHSVTLVAPEDEHTPKLRELGYDLITVRMDRRGIHPGRDLTYLGELYRVYRAVRPEVVLHFTVKPNIYGTVAARMLGIRAVNTVSGLGTVFLKKGVVSWVAQQLYRLSFRWADRVLFHNPDDYALFVARGLVAARRAAVVPGSGVNVHHYAPALPTIPQSPVFPSPSSILQFPASASQSPVSGLCPPVSVLPFTFLVIARLLIDKGVMEYAAAARLLRQQGVSARFQLLGARDPAHRRGIADAMLDGWIDEGLIDYLGTADDVRPFVQQADAVVLPSYREGLPRTLLEAASMEKPLVATDTPGCRHVIVDGYNGLLCRVRDASALADAMYRLQQMPPAEQQQMGRYGRTLVSQRFSEEYVIDQYRTFIVNRRDGVSLPASLLGQPVENRLGNGGVSTTNHLHHERSASPS
ncbi:MAG: glycosyltransferase family 4 protein [Tunicatimonas sp.]